MDMLLPQDMSLRFQGCSQGKAPQSPNGRFRFHPEALDNLLKSRMIIFRKTAEISQIPIAHFPSQTQENHSQGDLHRCS